jgi:hypothetical protein
LPNLLDINPLDENHVHVFRAIMELYLATTVLWSRSATQCGLLMRTDLISDIVFMSGLAFETPGHPIGWQAKPHAYRLQPDPPGQPSQVRVEGGMNSLLSAGVVPKRDQPLPCRQVNDSEIGLFLELIGVDSPC